MKHLIDEIISKKNDLNQFSLLELNDEIVITFRDVKDHAKKIYIELLKLEYPAATETHRKSLAMQSMIMALDFEIALNETKKTNQ